MALTLPPSVQRNLRIVAFFAVAFAMLAGPVQSQLLTDPKAAKDPSAKWYRGWRMFKGIGLGFIQVEATVTLADGSSHALTTPELFENPYAEPKNRRIGDGERVPRALRSSCARLPTGARVEGRWRKAIREGWTGWESVTPFTCGTGKP